MRTWQCKYLLGISELGTDLDTQIDFEAFAGVAGTHQQPEWPSRQCRISRVPTPDIKSSPAARVVSVRLWERV
jgi:hypothetical protein